MSENPGGKAINIYGANVKGPSMVKSKDKIRLDIADLIENIKKNNSELATLMIEAVINHNMTVIEIGGKRFVEIPVEFTIG